MPPADSVRFCPLCVLPREPMPQELICPKCDMPVQVPNESTGKQVRCPKCQACFSVPGAAQQSVGVKATETRAPAPTTEKRAPVVPTLAPTLMPAAAPTVLPPQPPLQIAPETNLL